MRNRLALLLLSAIVLLFLVLPTLVIVVVSFSSAAYLTFRPRRSACTDTAPTSSARGMAGHDRAERFAIDPTIATGSTLTFVLTALLLGGAHLPRTRGATR